MGVQVTWPVCASDVTLSICMQHSMLLRESFQCYLIIIIIITNYLLDQSRERERQTYISQQEENCKINTDNND